MNRTAILSLVCAALLGALARDLATSHARAEPPPAFDRQLAERLVRAVEKQAEGEASTARAVQEAGRACRR